MPNIARVAINSPLPQLDKLFDYVIPASLQSQSIVGCRVLVPFGKAKKPVVGFVIETSDESSHESSLSEIVELVSSVTVIKPEIYELCRQVANRQATSVSDVLRLAIQDRSVRVENTWLKAQVESQETSTKLTADNIFLDLKFAGEVELTGSRIAFEPVPHVVETQIGTLPGWVAQFVKSTSEALAKLESVVLIVPDYRDQMLLVDALVSIGLSEHLAWFSSQPAPSLRYAEFLKTLEPRPRVVVGSRTAVFAPVTNLGLMMMLDDGDSSLSEPLSPYIATREVALMRQKDMGFQLVFCGTSRSSEMQRLVELKFVEVVSAQFVKPTVVNSSSSDRVDTLAYNEIRKALALNGSVLIQVSTAGNSSALFCSDCSERGVCHQCDGPLWVDWNNKVKCRWCGAFSLAPKCKTCSGTKFRTGKAGVTRTVAEFGKAFPGIKIIESSGQKPILTLKHAKQLVIATCGSEPFVENGYDCVILLDGSNLLSRESLRSSEVAVRLWSNAAALASAKGRICLVGVSGSLGQSFALWDQAGIARAEFAARKELGFPPYKRLASISGETSLCERFIQEFKQALVTDGVTEDQVEILGPTFQGQDARYLLRFEYGLGQSIATHVRALSIKVSAGQKRFNATSGRSARPLKIKMDDSEVV